MISRISNQALMNLDRMDLPSMSQSAERLFESKNLADHQMDLTRFILRAVCPEMPFFDPDSLKRNYGVQPRLNEISNGAWNQRDIVEASLRHSLGIAFRGTDNERLSLTTLFLGNITWVYNHRAPEDESINTFDYANSTKQVFNKFQNPSEADGFDLVQSGIRTVLREVDVPGKNKPRMAFSSPIVLVG